MPRRQFNTTIPVAVLGLMNASSTLNERGLDNRTRQLAQDLADKCHSFLFERQDGMRRERKRLLNNGDVESLVIADFIVLLLHSYDDAAQAAAGVLAKAAGRSR